MGSVSRTQIFFFDSFDFDNGLWVFEFMNLRGTRKFIRMRKIRESRGETIQFLQTYLGFSEIFMFSPRRGSTRNNRDKKAYSQKHFEVILLHVKNLFRFAETQFFVCISPSRYWNELNKATFGAANFFSAENPKIAQLRTSARELLKFRKMSRFHEMS